MQSSKIQKKKTLTSVIRRHNVQRCLLAGAAILLLAVSFWFEPNVTSASNTTPQPPYIPGPTPVGATIHVTTTSQAIAADGFCSLPEAIYAANLDSNIAIEATNPDSFIFTECEAGSGDDTIVLPAGGVFMMSNIIDDAYNFMGPTATPDHLFQRHH